VFVLREKYGWLVAGGWFVVREKYYWLVADKPSEQGAEVHKVHVTSVAEEMRGEEVGDRLRQREAVILRWCRPPTTTPVVGDGGDEEARRVHVAQGVDTFQRIIGRQVHKPPETHLPGCRKRKHKSKTKDSI
jgi:hypothetical protein